MTSGVRLLRNDQLTQQVDYAYAATVDAPVRSIWVAGACPLDLDGRTVAVGDYAGQAHQVMRNLVTALEGAGASLTDVVKTTVYVASTRQSDLVTAWQCTGSTWGSTTSRARCSASPCSATPTSSSRSRPWRCSLVHDRGRSLPAELYAE